jgi:hypothetical protein
VRARAFFGFEGFDVEEDRFGEDAFFCSEVEVAVDAQVAARG